MAAPAPMIETEDDERRSGPTRRCLVTGAVRPKAELLRFVADPGGRIVPDVAGKLPGRGLWLTAHRDIVSAAASKHLFARAAKAAVVAESGIEDRVAGLLAERCIEMLGLARRAGLAVAGFAKVKALLESGTAAVLVEAVDAAADGQGKLAALAPGAARASCLSARELGVAFGREEAVHVALKAGRLADLFLVEARRLCGFRPGTKVDASER